MSRGKVAGKDILGHALGGCYGCGGGDAWIKTVRTYLGERIRLCDECYEVAREVLHLIIVPGDVSVTARCDLCWGYGSPRDFTDLRKSSGHADAYGGMCPECAAVEENKSPSGRGAR